MPWGEYVVEGEGPARQIVTLTYGETVDSAGEQFRYWVEGEGREGFLRIMGCALVARMPSEGLIEAINSLKEMWEYWSSQPASQQIQAPSIHKTGRVVQSGVRPELLLEG